MIPAIIGLCMIGAAIVSMLVIIICVAKGIYENDYYKDNNNEKCEV